MKAFLKVFVTIISILYPVLLCVLVGYFHIETKIVSLVMAFSNSFKSENKPIASGIASGLLKSIPKV